MNKDNHKGKILLLSLFSFVFSSAIVGAKELPDLQSNDWWGQVNNAGVAVRKEPDSESKKLGSYSQINRVKVLDEVRGESIGGSDIWYKIDGGAYPGAYIFSGNIDKVDQPEPPKKIILPTGVGETEYWIDVDLSKKVLTLLKGKTPVFVTYVATGKQVSPTVTGTYRIWYKVERTRMRGTFPRVYDLPNVPYAMFYHGSYAIHGTYWHDKFGTQQSAGCTNITQGDAKFLYEKVNPKDNGIVKAVKAAGENQGTVVYNHY